MTYMDDGNLSYAQLWFIFILVGALAGLGRAPDWTDVLNDGLFLVLGAFGGATHGAFALLLILLWHGIKAVWGWLRFSKGAQTE